MTTIRAHFDGRAFVPDEPIRFPLDQPVTLHIDSVPPLADTSTRKEERLRMLEEIRKLAIECDAAEADFSRDSIYSGTLDDPR